MDIGNHKKDSKKGAVNLSSPFKRPRDVDVLARNVEGWWGKTFVFIRKTRVKTWQAVFIIAFCAGAAATAVWTVSLKIQTSSDAAGPSATLSLVSSSSSVQIGNTFTVNVMLNTNSNKVVVAKPVVNYNKGDFQLQSWSTTGSVFASSNSCVYNGKPCEIVGNDTANGKITITVNKPTPGVTTASGKIATLTFKALRAVAPASNNITLSYTSGSYTDSDTILDNGSGTDILSGVTNAKVTVTDPSGSQLTTSNGSPSGTLSSGTNVKISLKTNKAAVCKYSTSSGTAYTSMTGKIYPDKLGTTHTRTFSSLIPKLYNLYVKCFDAAANFTTSDYLMSFTVSSPNPNQLTISNGSPSGTLSSGTNVKISLKTNKAAVCKYSTSSGTAYTSMTGKIYPDKLGTTHTRTFSSLIPKLYNLYVKCFDAAANFTTGNYLISFTVK